MKRNTTVDDYIYKCDHEECNKKLLDIYKMIKIVLKENVYKKLQTKLIYNMIWSITEVNGGKKKVRCWSAEAYKRYIENRKEGKKLRGLQHEHVVRIKGIIERLIESKRDEQKIDEILSSVSVCLVTNEEHTLLDKDNNIDGVDKYRLAGIIILDMSPEGGKRPITYEEFKDRCRVTIVESD